MVIKNRVSPPSRNVFYKMLQATEEVELQVWNINWILQGRLGCN